MKIPSIFRFVPLAAGALLAPLQAAPTPQEIFARLSAPGQQLPMDAAKRAAKLPALGCVPANADMVVAAADAGACSLELMRLLGADKPSDELTRRLSSISSAALVAGVGGASTLEQAMPILLQSSQMAMLDEAQSYWLEHAKPAYADAIRRAFAKQMNQEREHVLSSYEQFRLTPIYYALTAVPGREEDFRALHGEMLEGLRRTAQERPELSYEQLGAFAGVRMSQLDAWTWLMKQAPEDENLRRAMAQRQVHLLSMVQGGVALFVLCEHPGDIDLPQQPEFSMLLSPKLNGADAYMDSLLATGWMSSAFSKAAHACMEADRFPLARAVVDALRSISEQDVANQAAYSAAVKDIIRLVWQPPFFDDIRKPFALQIWQQGKELYMECTSDACGMDFAPGHLQLVGQAVRPDSVFYMESTAFSAPHPPNGTDFWENLSSSMLGAGKGIACTLKEEHRHTVDVYLRFAKLFMPEIQALGSAVESLCSGLGAPFALELVQEKGDDGKPHTAWAFCSAVRDRAGLGQSWQQMLTAVGQAAGKMGLPPMLVQALPVSDEKLGGSAVAHAIDLPGERVKALPQVAVSDSRFVMGNSAAFNADLMAAPNADMPFCGAVNSVDIPRMAAAVARMDKPACCSPRKERMEAFLQRLGERVQTLFSTSVIRNGVRTARGLMLLK